MQIQSVGQSQTDVKTQTPDRTSGIDSQIKVLNKQLEVIQKQIDELQKSTKKSSTNGIQNSEGSKAVQDQIKELQSQITQINQEIAKLQSEKFKKPEEEQTSSKKEDTIEKKLVKGASSYNDLKVQHAIKVKFKGRIGVLNAEIEEDKARGVDTRVKEAEVSNMSKCIDKIDGKLIKSTGKIVKEGTEEVETEEDQEKEKLEKTPGKYTDEDLKGNLIDEKA